MAQTTDGMTFRQVKVELSLDGSTWLDVSGSVSAVKVKGGERAVIDFRPLFLDTVLARLGARERVEISVKSVYTENPQEARDMLDAAYLARAEVGLRWTPSGGAPGTNRYRAVGARVKTPAFADGEVNESKPMLAEYALSADEVVKETI